ncbi:unnamed protein product [Rotaria sp. Silwood1]|nr:unnamed protein product [Rotaria sp. Silwood1]CAF1603750.1 unnamed protein product [Rotaria sp. Silwood1]
MVDQVSINNPYETFVDVAKERFCNDIYNCGRIVALYFTYKLISKLLKDEPSLLLNVVEWTVRFVRGTIAP